jgi:hypothetical protein
LVLSRFDARWGQGFMKSDAFIDQLHAGLGGEASGG